MADIFLSWGKPDEDHVRKLTRRLRGLGIELFEYSDDMRGGQDIPRQVVDEIAAARLAVICFSDETAHRQWIEREAAWAYQAWCDPSKPMNRLVPVWVGPHPEDRRPKLIEEENLSVVDLAAGGEARLLRLVRQLRDELGQSAPIVVPVVLLAMNGEQAEELIGEEGLEDSLANLGRLCTALGMPSEADLPALLARRYGPADVDFAPFAPGERLRRAVEDAVDNVNAGRQGKSPPLFLYWLQQDLFGPAGEARDEAIGRWRGGPSLLIVDSVSAFCHQVRDQLRDLPQPYAPGRSAVLWVPPYTGHTACVDALLREAAREVPQIADFFDDWVESRRPATFDSLTPTALRLSMERIFDALADDPGADPAALAGSRPPGAGRKSLRALQGPAPAGGDAP